MKALVSPEQIVTLPDGTEAQRLCELHETGFPVAEPLYWVDAPADLDLTISGLVDGAIITVPYTLTETKDEIGALPITDTGA